MKMSDLGGGTDTLKMSDLGTSEKENKTIKFSNLVKRASKEAITKHPIGQDISALLGKEEPGMGAGRTARGFVVYPVLQALTSLKNATVAGLKGDNIVQAAIGELGPQSFGTLMPEDVQKLSTGIPKSYENSNPFMELAAHLIKRGESVTVGEAIKKAEDMATVAGAVLLGGPAKEAFKELTGKAKTAVDKATIAIAKKIGKNFPAHLVDKAVAQQVASGKLSIGQAARMSQRGQASKTIFKDPLMEKVGAQTGHGMAKDPLQQNAKDIIHKMEKVFRGGEKFDISKMGERGIPVTKSKKVAETFLGAKESFRKGLPFLEKPTVGLEEYYINPSAKIATKKDIPNNIFKSYKEANPVITPEKAEPIIGRWAKKNGYDGVDFSTLGETSLKEAEIKIYNPNVLFPNTGEKLAEEVVHKMKVQDGVSAITRGKGFEQSVAIESMKQGKPGLIGKPLQVITRWAEEVGRPWYLTGLLDGFKENGPNTEYLLNELDKAKNFKLDEAPRTQQLLADEIKKLDLGKISKKKHDIGVKYKASKDNMLKIYAHSLNEKGRQYLVNSGISLATQKRVADTLSDVEKSVVHNIAKFKHEDQFPMVRDVHKQATGEDLGEEDFYFRITGTSPTSSTDVNADFADELTMGQYRKHKAVTPQQFTKERTEAPTRQFKDLSFLEDTWREWSVVEHYKAYRLPMQRAIKYIDDPRIEGAIKSKYGDDYYNTMKQWLYDTAYNGRPVSKNVMEEITKFARLNFVTSTLTGNIASILRQPVSFNMGMQMAGWHNGFMAMGKFLADPAGMIKSVKEASPTIRHRMEAHQREHREILAGRSPLAKILGKRTIRMTALLPQRLMDMMTVVNVWEAARLGKLRQTGDNEIAKRFADEVIRRTQPMGDIQNLPHLWRQGELARAMTLYQNQLNQNLNVTAAGYAKALNENGFGKKAIGVANHTISMALALGLSGYLIALLKYKRPPDKEEFAQATVGQFAMGVPLLGQLYEMSTMNALGHYSFPISANPPLEAPAKAYESYLRSKKPATKAKHRNRLLGYLSGLPVTAAERVVNTLKSKDISQLLGKKIKKRK